MLTKLLNKLKTNIDLVGLDIGTTSVKLIQLLKAANGYTVSAAVQEQIESSPEGEKTDQARVIDAVKKCLKKADLKSQNVVCGIAGPEVVVRGFDFPPLPEAAIEQAVRMEAQQVCPFESKNMVLDYQLVENRQVTPEQQASKVMPRTGLMVACTQELVKEKTRILTEAGAKPLLVDSDALALLNCLTELNLVDTDGTVAVIDIGWTLTNVIIYGKDGLPFVRDLNNAGAQMIQRVSQELQISEDEVCRVLRGQENSGPMQNKILLAMNNAIRPLAMAVNETLRFYSFQEKTSEVEKIYLSGGMSLVDTFVEFLSDAMPVQTQILDPFEKMHCEAGKEGNELIKTCGAGLALAAGLAMRTI